MPYDRDDSLEAGDIVWVDFGPPFGHEQSGRRPALVVSPRAYNERSSLVVVCPITRKVDAWALKVEIRGNTRVQGAVIVDQVRSIDRVARFTRKTERAGNDTLDRVYGMFAALFGIPVSN
ncbi:MAG TPA: type II toxin-antitoxin system PemK/MazF family toxin [Xanthobacteraceae bacterium]|nr:type II toxin-antitoxin system PemK/MazF family toxin [Xanthobacteraceae bacterium]